LAGYRVAAGGRFIGHNVALPAMAHLRRCRMKRSLSIQVPSRLYWRRQSCMAGDRAGAMPQLYSALHDDAASVRPSCSLPKPTQIRNLPQRTGI